MTDVLTARVVGGAYQMTLLALRVNNEPLDDLVMAAGASDQGWMYPPVRLVDGEHLFGGEDEWDRDDFDDGKVPILSCGCTLPGCDAVLVRITRVGETIMWSDFEVYREESPLPLGPFIFDAAAYEQALRPR